MKEKFDKIKYDNQYAKENYDRIAISVPKGQREIIKNYSKSKGFESVNDYIKNLIYNDMNGNKNISMGDVNITQSGDNSTVNIG